MTGRLATDSLSHEENSNSNTLYNIHTVEELKNMIPQIPWMRYFNGLFNDEIYENDTVIVTVPEFMKSFADLIQKTEKRVIANYMFWRLVEQSLRVLSKEWQDIADEYISSIAGKRQEKPRWEHCLSSLTGSLKIALSSYYVRNYFKEESKEAAFELVEYIYKEFLNILDGIDWMDELTKKEAKAKADIMKIYIGYPKELLNDTALLELYKNLTITDESYFKNMMNIRKWTTDHSFSQLRRPNTEEEWKKHARAAEVGAFYDALENSIDISAGILQNAFFNKDRPAYMNFGGIGYVIGHEITHGYDNRGRQFDKDGNIVDWWDRTTDEHFKEKSQCFIEQYGNYTAENGMKINGVNTQDENIADNWGLKAAYWAYHSWVKDNGPQPLLPGLKYSQSQLFWISAASIWCGKFHPEELKIRITSEPHSPNEFRVIGPMSNLPEFANDFNCPADTPMNKKNKCQIW